ncbi:ABC transporter substrate-binding protein [Actinospongicola halichondriae]|uniref:ABC transporter substrate-binding protein n=1 Tax=Actinospongicola halichondriae TaxID=3236844 RepID=UPI003D58BB2B
MRKPGKLRLLIALLMAFSLVAAACGDDDDSATGDESTTTEGSGGSGDGADGALAGMRGTTPLAPLDDSFKDRLLEVDPELVDFNYGPETYDAIIVSALAVEVAGTDGAEYGNEINGVTRDGEKCTGYAECLALIEAGTDIDYDGVSGPLDFSGNGEPTVASYGILTFGDDNRIDDDATEFVTANAPEEADVPQEPVTATREGDGVFKVGTLLPETGSLAFLGPPEFAGAQLAINEINEAGGVLDKPAELSNGDSGDTTTDIANSTTDRLLSENVDLIVGAASSSVSLTVIDKITTAGVAMFSPANTSKKFSTYDDKGLYFRNAPSDILQGATLADIVLGDGITNVFILALDDDYGTGLVDDFTAAFEAGGGEVIDAVIYDPAAQTFDAEVGQAVSADAEGTLLIGFDESSRILTVMVEQGIGPRDKPVYGSDGNMGNALGENFDAGK